MRPCAGASPTKFLARPLRLGHSGRTPRRDGMASSNSVPTRQHQRCPNMTDIQLSESERRDVQEKLMERFAKELHHG
jgi:hypothetical protein